MKLALLGATGGVGRGVLHQALAAGHAVTAVVRNPSKLPTHVDAVQQDLASPDVAVLADALRNVDAVISALGPHRAAETGIVAPATAAIASRHGGAGVRRVVVISAAPVGVVPSTHRPQPPRYDPGDNLLMRYLLSPFIRRIFGRRYTDLAAMEDLLHEGTLDWTAIRPPRLTNGPLTGTYRTATDRNVRHGLTISRPDVAHLMLTVLQQPQAVRHSVGIAYWRRQPCAANDPSVPTRAVIHRHRPWLIVTLHGRPPRPHRCELSPPRPDHLDGCGAAHRRWCGNSSGAGSHRHSHPDLDCDRLRFAHVG